MENINERKINPTTTTTPPGNAEALSIFRIFPVKFRKRYQSHFEALGRHLFVRDSERCTDDCPNSSNPTYSRSSHKHAQHVLPNICHFPQLSGSLESVSAAAEAIWSLDWGKMLRLCGQMNEWSNHGGGGTCFYLFLETFFSYIRQRNT